MDVREFIRMQQKPWMQRSDLRLDFEPSRDSGQPLSPPPSRQPQMRAAPDCLHFDYIPPRFSPNFVFSLATKQVLIRIYYHGDFMYESFLSLLQEI